MRTTYLPLIAVVLAVLALFSRPTLAEEEEIAYVLVEENQTLTEPGKTTTVDNVTTTNVTVTNQTTTTGDATVTHANITVDQNVTTTSLWGKKRMRKCIVSRGWFGRRKVHCSSEPA